MSWKSIDMQIALNRAPDAGKLQDQLMKENQHFQESLSQSKIQQDEEMRKRVNTYEDVEQEMVHEDDENEEHKEDNADNSSTEQEKEDKAIHPYLGKKIDYSG